VHRGSGDTVPIDVKPGVSVSAVILMQLADIKPGSFVGTSTITGTDGKLTATEVHVLTDRVAAISRKASGQTTPAFIASRARYAVAFAMVPHARPSGPPFVIPHQRLLPLRV
jgi:hypothetical protein